MLSIRVESSGLVPELLVETGMTSDNFMILKYHVILNACMWVNFELSIPILFTFTFFLLALTKHG